MAESSDTPRSVRNAVRLAWAAAAAGNGGAPDAPDEWSAAISRMREQNARRREERGGDAA